MTYTTFGKQFSDLREKKGLSQAEVARRLGHATNSYVADVESGQFVPAPDKLLPLARALGVQVIELAEMALESKIRDLGVRDPARMAPLLDPYAIAGTIHQVDVCRDEQLTGLVASVHPDITFNLAGYGVDRSERDEAMAFRINDRLVGVLVEVLAGERDASWCGQHLVHIGSALEYGRASGDLVEST